MPRKLTEERLRVLEAAQQSLRQKEATLKAQQSAKREEIRRTHAALRLERQVAAGKLVDAAGLLDEDPATLAHLFAWAKDMLRDPERWALVQGLTQDELSGVGGV